MQVIKTLTFIFSFLFTFNISATGDLYERILNLTEEIKNNPDNAKLYLNRGELYFQFEEFQKSLLDFQQCEKLGLVDSSLDYQLASVHLRLNNYEETLSILDVLIKKGQNLDQAWRLKGRTHYLIKEFDLAGNAFEQAILNEKKPLLDIYLEASHAWEKGASKNHLANAKNILLDGILELGDISVFYNRLIDLEVQSNNYTTAINFASLLLETAQRKETALVKRAKLFKHNGQFENAKEDLLEAKKLINKRHQNSELREQYLQSIDQELNHLNQNK